MSGQAARIRLGTRGSALALIQAEAVAAAARRSCAATTVEIVTIVTAGDRGHSGDKTRWIDTIERALVDGEIDLAVHSAKDVPAANLLAAGTQVVAALPREDARDVLVGVSSLDRLPPGARVGTASLRRKAQLLALRPDLNVLTLRGNVPTRLAKLDGGACDALVLAAAGLNRLGLEARIGGPLDVESFVPAPGQGLIALQGRAIPTELVDADGLRALRAERAVVEALAADCDTPVGCYDDGAALHVFVGMPDGSSWLRDRVVGQGSAEERAQLAIERLTALGADDLLARAAAAANDPVAESA